MKKCLVVLYLMLLSSNIIAGDIEEFLISDIKECRKKLGEKLENVSDEIVQECIEKSALFNAKYIISFFIDRYPEIINLSSFSSDEYVDMEGLKTDQFFSNDFSKNTAFIGTGLISAFYITLTSLTSYLTYYTFCQMKAPDGSLILNFPFFVGFMYYSVTNFSNCLNWMAKFLTIFNSKMDLGLNYLYIKSRGQVIDLTKKILKYVLGFETDINTLPAGLHLKVREIRQSHVDKQRNR